MIFQTKEASIDYSFTEVPGTSPLLFLHGALGTAEQFAKYQNLLAERSIVLVDFPSHGKSTTTRDAIDTHWLAEMMLELLDHLGIEQVDTIGYSLGGYVAMEMTNLSPARVKSIVSHGMKFYWTPDAIADSITQMDENTVRKAEKFFASLSKAHSMNGVERTLALSQSIIRQFSDRQLDLNAFLATKTPIMLSVGDRDELVPLDEILRLYQTIGLEQSALAVHSNTRHPFHTLAPNSLVRATRQFWQARSLD